MNAFRIFIFVIFARTLLSFQLDSLLHDDVKPTELLRQFGIGNDRASLAKGLVHKESVVRRAALSVISERLERSLTPNVMVLLDARDRSTQVAAASTLIDLGNAKMKDTLYAALRDDSVIVRIEAARFLCVHKDPAGESVIANSIHDTDINLRVIAVEAAGRCLPSGRILDLLLAVMKTDESPDIRLQALLEVESVHSQEVVQALIDSLEDKNSYVRFGASEALQRVTNHRIPFAHNGPPDGRKQAILSWKVWLRANRGVLQERKQ